MFTLVPILITVYIVCCILKIIKVDVYPAALYSERTHINLILVENYRKIPVTDMQGGPNCCYTIESLIEQPNTKDTLYPAAFSIQLLLDTQPEEYGLKSIPVMMQIKLHNRRALINPFYDGYSLKGGMNYNAYVSLRTQELLPPPYDTSCFDYLELWKKNNGTGPLNRWMCKEYCQMTELFTMGSCIDRQIRYPHKFKLCDKNDEVLTNDIVKKCALKCPDACYEYFYDVRYEKIEQGQLERNCYKDDELCKLESITLNIIFNDFRVSKMVYKARFESVEMFSYIGGYMGMWLGVSLASLFDLLETICKLLFYPIMWMNAGPTKPRKNARVLKFHPSLGTVY